MLTIVKKQNLIANSEDFIAMQTAGNLSVGGVNMTTGFPDPFGGNNATQFLDNATTGYHYCAPRLPKPLKINKYYTVSFFIKSLSENSWITFMWVLEYSNGAQRRFILSFNSFFGGMGSASNDELRASDWFKITKYALGWYRIELTGWMKYPGWPLNFLLTFEKGGVWSWTSDGTYGFQLIGMQFMETNHPIPYAKTDNTIINTGIMKSKVIGQNLIKWSEEIDQWQKDSSVVITANQTIAPNGELEGDLVDLTATPVGAGIYSGYAPNVVDLINNQVKTKSIFLKGEIGGEIVDMTDPNLPANSLRFTLSREWQQFTITEGATLVPDSGGVWIKKVSGNKIYVWGGAVVSGNACGKYWKTQDFEFIGSGVRKKR